MATEPIKVKRAAEVLVIDDTATDALLTRKGFAASRVPTNLRVASCADQAFAILRHEEPYAHWPTPDLIMLDLHMPKTDGKTFLAMIKKDPKLKKIPVIVLTGSQAESDVLQTYALDAFSFIIKPVNLRYQTFIEDLLERCVQK